MQESNTLVLQIAIRHKAQLGQGDVECENAQMRPARVFNVLNRKPGDQSQTWVHIMVVRSNQGTTILNR